MARVKEYGNLSLEQQSKLMQEIADVEKIEDIDEAVAEAAELKNFIRMLFNHGFIGSDKACRYRQGLDSALESRRKKNA